MIFRLPVYSIVVLLVGLPFIFSCTAIQTTAGLSSFSWPAPMQFEGDRSYLDQLNERASKNNSWFEALELTRNAAEARYAKTDNKRLGIYLENDIYIYNDNELNEYLSEIVDVLYQGFDGPSIDIEIVVETSTRFGAYVDELNQIHVTTALLRSLDNEDQLAGILAHELAHILLRHDRDRKASQTATSVINFMGKTLSEINALDKKRRGDNDDLQLDFVGIVWTDIMSPRWSRESERQADLLASDLLKVAGYDHEQLIQAIEKIHDANVTRSQRVSRISELSKELIQKKKRSYRDKQKDYQKELIKFAESTANELFESVYKRVDKGTISHKDRDERTSDVKEYLLAVHPSLDLPPDIRIARFDRIVRKPGDNPLRGDLAAVETIIALGNKNLTKARSAIQRISQSDDDNIQVSISMAQLSMDVARRQFDTAIEKLEALSIHPYAPSEVYIKLAKLYAWKRDFPAADNTLQRGTQKVGRSYRFLPTAIELHKVQQQTKAAEEATLECARYDGYGSLKLVGGFLGYDLEPEDSYYNHCAGILGYDVRAKRRQAQLDNIQRIQSQGKDFLERLRK